MDKEPDVTENHLYRHFLALRRSDPDGKSLWGLAFEGCLDETARRYFLGGVVVAFMGVNTGLAAMSDATLRTRQLLADQIEVEQPPHQEAWHLSMQAVVDASLSAIDNSLA